MIFIGSLSDLAREYASGWTGRGRRAYVMTSQGLSLKSDFVRWLGRQAIKNREGEMVLKNMTEKEGTTVLVFEGNDAGKTIERLVAEVIWELGRNFQGVPCSALHFASFHHPFSTMQRLRDIRKAWKKEWIKTHCQDELPLSPGYVDPIRFVKKENKYYFLVQDFFPWLYKTYIENEVKVEM